MLKGYGAFFAFLVRFGAFWAMKYLGASILPGAFGYTSYCGSTVVLVLVLVPVLMSTTETVPMRHCLL
eukprot:SAG11_NODE_3551_length_2375_cov_23.030756_2_plen_68_part_00